MPILRYSLRIEGETYTLDEQDTFPPTDDPEGLITEQILKPLQANRSKYNEPQISLVNVVVINPYIHLHTWKKLRADKFACKQHYECERCKITAFRKLHIMLGEYGGIQRDESYASDRNYTYCKDPLKPMAKTLVFR